MANDRIYIILPGILLIRLIITVLTIATFSTEGCAQERHKDTTVVWDLETCIGYARQNNISLKRLKLAQRTSEQESLLSKAARTPDMYLSATQFINHNMKSAAGTNNVFGSGDYGLSSSWTLYRGGYLNSDVRQKNLQVEAANLDLLQQENDLTLQIIQHYLNVLLDRESIFYGQVLVSTSAAQVDRAKQQLAAGSIARKELLQLQAQLASDNYSVITFQNAKRQDLVNLRQLLQLPSTTTLEVVVPDPLIMPVSLEGLTEVQQQAVSNRLEIKNGILGIQIAEAGLDKARSGFKPTLTLSGFSGTGYAGASPGYFRQLSNRFNQQIGLTLSVPVFTRKVNAVNVAEAKIEVDQAKLRLTETRTALWLTIERAYITLINAQSQFQAAQEAFKYNEETFRVADEQLKTGLINMVEYQQQKTLYIQAQQQFLQAKYNAALSYRIYDFYKGINQAK